MMENTALHSDTDSVSDTLNSLSTEDFLRLLGRRIRIRRTSNGMSRKRLAQVSGVSERYLAQLESGHGNMSIALLRKVTRAIDLPLQKLLADSADVLVNVDRAELA